MRPGACGAWANGHACSRQCGGLCGAAQKPQGCIKPQPNNTSASVLSTMMVSAVSPARPPSAIFCWAASANEETDLRTDGLAEPDRRRSTSGKHRLLRSRCGFPSLSSRRHAFLCPPQSRALAPLLSRQGRSARPYRELSQHRRADFRRSQLEEPAALFPRRLALDCTPARLTRAVYVGRKRRAG